ncbi:hypothetical protein [Marinoscillum sp. MHG1-6]|uniref:hypothetical protein n=1 Tax=Marinoscillum sp. MHG1-6 TaxID=2959627 RepID=UPI00215773F9|nr:hypothetical protein [Marinoscillum sp. MHG1-6]
MRKLRISIILSAFALFFICSDIMAQGVSFSYLIPKNGYLSAPISPFSIRGVGIGGRIGAETGFSLYSIPGLPMNGLPFETDRPISGQGWSILVPGQLTLSLKAGNVGIKFLGGGFAILNLSTSINKGNLDRALMAYEGWDVATSSINKKTKPGLGWMAGTEFEFKVNRKFSITAEVEYLSGSYETRINGSYAGGQLGQPIASKDLNFDNAKTLLEGIEISLGVKMGGK